MSEQIVIKSVLKPDNIRFTNVDGFYENNLLVWSFGAYEVMGDGECQHTPVYRIGLESFTDFCLSVASHLISHPDTKVHAYQVGLKTVGKDTIDFLLSVKHSETVRRWFSLALKAVSKNEAKQHDKRWMEIPSWADGTPKSAHDLYRFALDHRQTYLEEFSVFQCFLENAGGYFFGHDECCKWKKDIAGDWQHAFRALRSAFDAKEHLDMAKRCIDASVQNCKLIEDEKSSAAS